MLKTLIDKITGPLAIAFLVLAVVFAAMWKSSASDLSESEKKLARVQDALTQEQESSRKLQADLDLKSKLNSDLQVEIAGLNLTYVADTNKLNARITELENQPDKTVTVDNIKYVKETYVKEAAVTVLDSLWDSYCKTNTCQGAAP